MAWTIVVSYNHKNIAFGLKGRSIWKSGRASERAKEKAGKQERYYVCCAAALDFKRFSVVPTDQKTLLRETRWMDRVFPVFQGNDK